MKRGSKKQFLAGVDYLVATWGGQAKYRCVDIRWNRKSASFAPARRSNRRDTNGKEFRVRIALTNGVENCLSDSVLYGRLWADKRWDERGRR